MGIASRAGISEAAAGTATDNAGHGGKTAVVVGSGFGGSVAALRLGQAGYKVTVLERGRSWEIQPDGKTFPPTLFPDGRSAWFSDHANLNNSLRVIPVERYPGLIDRIDGNGIDAVYGAGVGGGSLAFGSFTPQPRRKEWEQIFPPEISYDEMEKTWFPLAKRELGVSPMPEDILAHLTYSGARTWLDVVHAAGGEVTRHDIAINWDIVRAELAGKAVPSVTVGEYVFGTNSGAKISLDQTYLKRAQATGNVEIRSMTQVVDLVELSDGRMRVGAHKINDDGAKVGDISIDADLVVMAAGSFRTTEMLLRWRSQGRLPKLSPEVGKNYGTNGDFIYSQAFPRPGFGPVQAGPGIGVFYDDDNSQGPVTISWEAAPIPFSLGSLGTMNLVQIMTDQRGEITWDSKTQRATLNYPFTQGFNEADIRARNAVGSFHDRAYVRHGQPANGIPIWTPLADLGSSTTWDGLGGTVMDNARVHNGAAGAVSTTGAAHGYSSKLLVLDGSAIPGTVGMVNPALTITALAERAIAAFLR